MRWRTIRLVGAQHSAVAALAPQDLRGSAFDALATVQSQGNLVASAVAGVLWSTVSPDHRVRLPRVWMRFALTGLLISTRH